MEKTDVAEWELIGVGWDLTLFFFTKLKIKKE